MAKMQKVKKMGQVERDTKEEEDRMMWEVQSAQVNGTQGRPGPETLREGGLIHSD